MNRHQRNRKRKRAQAHGQQQIDRKAQALTESVEAARKAKKGKKGIVAQMKRRGYALADDAPANRPQSYWRDHNLTVATA